MTEAGFTFESEHFAGPLDALLDLIEKRKLAVSNVSLAEVCDGYLAYVESLPELPLSETSQFILVASTLLLIKSRALLPTVDLSEDEEHSIEELERRLQRLATIRKGAKLLRKEWGRAPVVLERRAPDIARVLGVPRASFAPGESSVERIVKAVRRIVATLPTTARLGEAVVAPVLVLEDVIMNLKTRLQTARTRWSELSRGASRGDMIVHFLAILELVRHGSVSVTQDRLFSDIIVESDEAGAPRYG